MHVNLDTLFKEKLPVCNFKSFLLKSFETLYPKTKFQDNWHIELMKWYLFQVEGGGIKRLLINIPPRSLKSTIISVIWPAWLLANDPAKKIIVASYSQALSNKHSVETRLILNSAWFKELYPATHISPGCNQKNKFVTSKQGFRFATSIGGTLTGEGADILIVDDPHTPLQAASDNRRGRALEWYDQTFSTRLNSKSDGAILVIMQRLHNDDLSGHLLAKTNWQHLNLQLVSQSDAQFACGKFQHYRKRGQPLIPLRDGIREIIQTKVDLGSYGFHSQYQQAPASMESGLIKLEWLQYYDPDKLKESGMVVQSWDCAVKVGLKNDYSVCTTWLMTKNAFYLLHVMRGKYEYSALKSVIVECYNKFNPSAVLIEDKASGQSIIQDIRKMNSLPITAINPKYSKEMRVISVLNMFESGKVFVPHKANWLDELLHECAAFPNVAHDDQVDSISQFLEWANDKSLGKTRTIRSL